jgi:hypothetical protein
MADLATRTITTIRKADLLIHVEGSIVLFTPMTAAAKQWIDEHVADDRQWFGPALVIEHRYADHLFNGMAEAGLSFAGSPSERGH